MIGAVNRARLPGVIRCPHLPHRQGCSGNPVGQKNAFPIFKTRNKPPAFIEHQPISVTESDFNLRQFCANRLSLICAHIRENRRNIEE